MIFSVFVPIKEIVFKGRDSPWPRPVDCSQPLDNRDKGNGFVSTFFDDYVEEVLLRRHMLHNFHGMLICNKLIW
jgi:hypothetical protein